MNKKRRKILTVNDQLEPQQGGSESQPILALTFYTSDNQVLEHRCLNINSVTPPSEWKDLTGTIEIEEGVTGIAREAFKNFAARTYTVPNTLTYIGDMAFMSSSVQTIDLTGLDNCVIGGSAFAFCHNLTSIHIPAGTTNLQKAYGTQSGMFSNCTNLTSVTFGNPEIIIGNYAFDSCTSLNLSSLSASSIGQGAFIRCSSLTDLIIDIVGQESNPVIGDQAFALCTNLETIVINGKTNIGYEAFSYCSNLQTLKLGQGCMHISQYAFKNCSNLSSIYFLGSKAYAEHNTYENYLGNSLCFSGCTKIKNVYVRELMPNYTLGPLATICNGESIFSQSTESSKTIYGVRYFGNPIQYQQKLLFNIPEGTTTTLNYLSNCNGFTNIALPSTLTSITSTAFAGCKLKWVACFATTPPTISDEYVLNQEIDLQIFVPKDSLDVYKQAQGWSDYSDKISPLDSIAFNIEITGNNYNGGDSVAVGITIRDRFQFNSISEVQLINSEEDTLSNYIFIKENNQQSFGSSGVTLEYSYNTWLSGTLTHTLTEDDISNGSYTFRGTVTGVLRNINVSADFEATVNLQ